MVRAGSKGAAATTAAAAAQQPQPGDAKLPPGENAQYFRFDALYWVLEQWLL
jgi:hypothetical protein